MGIRQNNSTIFWTEGEESLMTILFELFYFGETFVHEQFTQNKKEVVIDGNQFRCKETGVICEHFSTVKSKFLILKQEELQTIMVNRPKQNMYISCVKKSAIVIDSDALIVINFQKEKGYQVHIYPSRSPVYYNQRLIRAGNFVFGVGDQVVVDYWIIEMCEKQLRITGLGKEIQLNPWVFIEEPYLPEYPNDFPFFRRSPRVYLEVPKNKIDIRIPSSEIADRNQPFIKMIAPSLGMSFFSGVMSFFNAGSAIMLLGMWSTSILTMVLSATSYFWRKKEEKRKNEEDKKAIQKYMLQKTDKLRLLQKRQKEVLEYLYPSMDQLALMTKEYHSRIYERKIGEKDFLTIRLGEGEVPISFQIDIQSAMKDYLSENDMNIAAIHPYKKLAKAPVVISLKDQVLGLVGTSNVLRVAIQSLLFQISVLHSYREVELILLLPEKEYETKWKDWRWLPHNRLRDFPFSQSLQDSHRIRGIVYNTESQVLILNAFHKVLIKRRQQLRKSSNKKIVFKPVYVFSIVAEYWLTGHEINEFLVEDMNQYGVIVIWTKEESKQLPETVTTLIEYQSKNFAVLVNLNNQYVNQEFSPHALPVVYPIEKAILKLANLLHEEVGKNRMPEYISLMEQYKVQQVEDLEIIKRWLTAEPNHSLRSLIGWQTNKSEIYWDLHERVHGPHALIGGTTGSGKSEFLITYLLGLAINFSPEDIGMLIIDWKGGGVAHTLDRLPHFMGAITNLDRAGITRALTSIKAELEKRQKLFAEAGVNNIHDYMDIYKKRAISGILSKISRKPIPHLFLVVDEFAELKTNAPEFLDGLTSVARIGRSLGVHLILATQKTAGIVNDQIEANSASKIALKMPSIQDSNELLKTPDAAYITQPGRGYLKVGENDVYEIFQSGYTGREYQPNKSSELVVDERIFMINELGQLKVLYEPKEKSQGKNGQNLPTHREAVIDEIIKTVKHSVFVIPDRPWLPELPKWLPTPGCKANGQRNLTIPIGLLDIPNEQQQCIYYFELAKNRHIAIFASQGYGKSTFLQMVVLNIVRQNTPNQVNFFLIDFGNNGLLPLKKLPHVVDIATLEEEDKLQRMLDRLEEILGERKELFKEDGTVNFWQYDKKESNKLPVIFVILDSYEGLSVEDKRKEKVDEFLLRLLREGVSLGIYLILSASRIGSIHMKMMSQIATKLLMYLNDSTEANLIANNKKLVDFKAIQGRGQVMLEQPTIIQFYLPAKGSNDSEILKNMEVEITKIDTNWLGSRPKKIPMISDRLTAQDVYQYVEFKEKNKLYLGLNQRSAKVETFEFFQSNCLGLFFSTNNQYHNVLPWFLKQLIDSKEELILIDCTDALKKMKSSASIYIDKYQLSEHYCMFNIFWQTLLRKTDTKKIIVINGIAEFIEKMALSSDEREQLLNGSTANIQLIFIDHLIKISHAYDGMIYAIKENISQVLLGDNLQAQLFLEDVSLNRENRLFKINWLHNLKNGGIETIVVPMETNDLLLFE